MVVTVRNRFLLRLLGYQPADQDAVVTQHIVWWWRALVGRVIGRVRGWSHMRTYGPLGDSNWEWLKWRLKTRRPQPNP